MDGSEEFRGLISEVDGPEEEGEWSDWVEMADCPCCQGRDTFQVPDDEEQARGILEACQRCGFMYGEEIAQIPDWNKRNIPPPGCERIGPWESHKLVDRWSLDCPVCLSRGTLRVVLGEHRRRYCVHCKARNPRGEVEPPPDGKPGRHLEEASP